jgi:hypothetical protein
MGHQNYYLYLNQLFLLAFSGGRGCLSEKCKKEIQNVV